MAKIYIAGAHSRGTTMGYYLKYLDPSIEIISYLYDNEETNPKEVDGIPVIKIDEFTELQKDCPVYLGMRGINQSSITNTLKKCGVQDIIPVDFQLDSEIRNRFLKKYYSSVGKEFIKIDELDLPNGTRDCFGKEAKIYVASSSFDKPLQQACKLEDYEEIIQVGADLSSERLVTDYFDNVGENISKLNGQFCELTGLYWIWKHAKEDIVGLEHYRRHFLLPMAWKERMEFYNVDVILPTPLYVSPSIDGNYRKRHIENNWDNMLTEIKKRDKNEYALAVEFFNKSALYSPCNMFIMRKEILNDLCCWLFPILFEVAKKGGQTEDLYQNRYPGFISERLITFFFEKNRDKYKVVFADKNFLP